MDKLFKRFAEEDELETGGGARRLLTDAEEADLEISKLDL